ncbi:MAG TPA: nucleotidyltransferase domain-containing protein, partial [Dehalococcoidia bacterium]|nr:nucleotidyltransferase domain-containing protein [Dehalococcoidia bacterium]
FGSLARDEAVPGSDVDLLLILDNTDLPMPDRFNRYRPDRFPVGVEVFAYTEDEARRMLEEENAFLKRALREAITLFERSEARRQA